MRRMLIAVAVLQVLSLAGLLPAGAVEGLPPRVKLALDHGRLEEAQRLLSDELRRAPRRLELLVGMAEIAMERRRFEEARQLYQRVRKLEPRNVEARIGLGKLHLFQGRPREAFENLQEVVEEEPENSEARRFLRFVLAVRKDPPRSPLYLSLIKKAVCSRAEFAFLAHEALRPFWDQSMELPANIRSDTLDHWAGNSLNLLANHGILEEYPNHTLEPDAPLSYHQLAWAFWRIAQRLNVAARPAGEEGGANGRASLPPSPPTGFPAGVAPARGRGDGAAPAEPAAAVLAAKEGAPEASQGEESRWLRQLDQRAHTYPAWRFVVAHEFLPEPAEPGAVASQPSCEEVEASLARLTGFLDAQGALRRGGSTP
ncbi:MAG: tetratricopeptide repeat protein [Candidatus Tectomicrobia bacterium]|nr:tetratricopeptide repeat protein [Candidatus Tectomicrobia bacterium]